MIRRFQTNSARDLAESDLGVVLTDQTGTLRDQENLSGRAVVDILGDLGSDLARQVGTQSGDQRRGNHRAGLQHVGTGGRFDAIGTDCATIDIAVQEGELVILRHQITRAGGRWRGRLASGRDRDGRRSHLPDVGCREEIAGARRLLLLGNALLLRRWTGRRCRHAGRRSAGIGDRPAEIAGKRRPQLGCGFRQAGVVARQIGEAIRGHPVARVVQLGPGGLVLRPESQEQGAADSDGRNRAKAEEDLAGEPRHRRSAGPQPHFLRRPIAVGRPRRLFMRGFGHDCGLPSVRTIRTFCWGSPPSRNSAAANSRSTIMWLPWTR